MKVLITGGTGFVGTQLTSRLLREGHEITILTRSPERSEKRTPCSPNPVRNRDLAKTLGKVLKRPSFFPAPGFMIKLFLGEFGSVILEGQRVIPKRLLESGFIFKYPDIAKALENIVGF